MTTDHNILFLAEGPFNLHLMAEAFALKVDQQDCQIFSASMAPPQINPLVSQVMLEKQIDLRNR